MSRVFNFSAGPAALPEKVLRQAADEMLDWHGAGCGVMEMSHRGQHFTGIIERAEADLRELLAVPDNYRVLFLQGGATQHFAQIPMNLLGGASADYVVTGGWSQKAFEMGSALAPHIGARVRLAATSAEDGFRDVPRAFDCDDAAAYLHLCTNETVHGVEEFDARDRALVWHVTGGKHRYLLGETDRICDDDIADFRRAAIELLDGPAGLTLEDVEREHARLTARWEAFSDCADGLDVWRRLGVARPEDVPMLDTDAFTAIADEVRS